MIAPHPNDDSNNELNDKNPATSKLEETNNLFKSDFFSAAPNDFKPLELDPARVNQDSNPYVWIQSEAPKSAQLAYTEELGYVILDDSLPAAFRDKRILPSNPYKLFYIYNLEEDQIQVLKVRADKLGTKSLATQLQKLPQYADKLDQLILWISQSDRQKGEYKVDYDLRDAPLNCDKEVLATFKEALIADPDLVYSVFERPTKEQLAEIGFIKKRLSLRNITI